MYNDGMADFRTRILPYIFITLLLAGFVWLVRTPRCKTYDCIRIPGKSVILADAYEDTGAVWRGLLRSDDREVRVKILHTIAGDQAEEITKIHLAALLGLYDVALSPYPGAISQTVRCDAAFKPLPKKLTGPSGQSIVYFVGLLNARMQYGSCIENQIAYRSYAGILYCEKIQKWAQIELMVPKDAAFSDSDGERFIQNITCKK